jgi:hypothetical protein
VEEAFIPWMLACAENQNVYAWGILNTYLHITGSENYTKQRKARITPW